MSVVRVATYPVDAARIEELRRSVDAELVPLYRKQSGFESMFIVNAGDQIVSVSRWSSTFDAEQGSKAAIDWAKSAPGSTGPPSAVHIGEEMNSG